MLYVLKFKPDYYNAFYQKGNAFFNMGRYQEAIIIFEEILKNQNFPAASGRGMENVLLANRRFSLQL
jgi:tetratricopeptide (TPR) repeat protein